jgi:rhodanese-related sulfurtransferase
VAARWGVVTIDPDQLAAWQSDSTRTTMVFDVRSPEEYVAGHRAGSYSAPGGQLVQATDQYVATRNARLVLVDDDGVRATMSASWLRRLGWPDAVVLDGGLAGELEIGEHRSQAVGEHPATTITVADLAAVITDPGTTIVDLADSVTHRRGHLPGAWWTTRNRLEALAATTARAKMVVLVSPDDQMARVAFADAVTAWDHDRVVVLEGGTGAWVAAGHDLEEGQGRQLGPAHDVWAGPMAGRDRAEVEAAMQAYLVWEIALTDQVDGDPTVTFNL